MYKSTLFSAAVVTAMIHMLLSKEKPAKCYTKRILKYEHEKAFALRLWCACVYLCVCKHADFPVVCRFNVYDTRIHTVLKWRGHTHRAFTIHIKTGKSVEMEEKWFSGVSSIHASSIVEWFTNIGTVYASSVFVSGWIEMMFQCDVLKVRLKETCSKIHLDIKFCHCFFSVQIFI